MSIKLWCCSRLCWWNAGRVEQIAEAPFWHNHENCVKPELQKLELNLWSQSPIENIVFGLEENSMRLYQDGQEAINANNIGPEEFKFCYVEVKLISTDQEQFENINYWDCLNQPHNRSHCKTRFVSCKTSTLKENVFGWMSQPNFLISLRAQLI